MKLNPIIVAIDTANPMDARRLITLLQPHVGGIKLGLTFFVANGPKGVKDVMKDINLPLMLDLKLHDIPETVSQAALAIAQQIQPEWLTLHCAGGVAMMRKTVDILRDHKLRNTKLLGVTVLTSLNEAALWNIGYCSTMTVTNLVATLATQAYDAGLDGIVCSAQEIEVVLAHLPYHLLFDIVVPGIRPKPEAANSDQMRIATPKAAIVADYLVIGRPITATHNPVKACTDILESLGRS